MARALTHYEAAYALALASVPAAVPQVEEMLGVAYLHKAGMDSNIFRQPNDTCLVPGTPGQAYSKTADVEKAIALFTKYLERRPDDEEGRWLLNMAYMAMGTWPDAVPVKFRIARRPSPPRGRRPLHRRCASQGARTSSPAPAASSSTTCGTAAASTS